jgi:hypothetical protein
MVQRTLKILPKFYNNLTHILETIHVITIYHTAINPETIKRFAR